MSALFRKVVGKRAGSTRRAKASRGSLGLFLSLFGLPFLLGGLLAAGGYFLSFQKWLAARSWVETPCQILSAELDSRRGEDSTTYQAVARYHYVFAGRTFEGDQVGLDGGSDNLGDFHQRVHRELSGYVAPAPAERGVEADGEGRLFRCYVNPANPAQAVLYRDLRWEKQAFMAVFALVFPAAGAGMSLGGLLSLLANRRRKRLAAAHPDRPWRWRPQWQETTVAETPAPWRWGVYALTAWGAVVVVPLLGAVAASGALARGGAAWAVLVYPVLWCVPAVLSLRFIRRRLATGRARLELARLPVSPGAWLAGAVVLGNRVRLMTGAVASLRCERRITTRSGNDSSIRTETEWSHEEHIDSTAVGHELLGTRIPLRIAVPPDLPPSGPQPDDPEIEVKWTLRLKVPGSPVEVAFEIPVFHDPSAPVAAAEPVAARGSRTVDLPAALAEERLVAAFDPDGRLLTLHAPFRRNLALFLFLLVFNLVWTGAAWLLIAQHAPLVFRVVWPVSAAVIWLVLLRLLLYRSTLALRPDGLTLLHRLGPLAWRKELPRDRITGFRWDTNMQQNGHDIWRVRVESATGRPVTLLGGIRQRTTAEALVAALNQWRE